MAARRSDNCGRPSRNHVRRLPTVDLDAVEYEAFARLTDRWGACSAADVVRKALLLAARTPEEDR